MKTTLLVFIWVLVALSTVMFGRYVFFQLQHGCGAHEVAGAYDGGVVDWPTRERPLWTMFPAYIYAIGFFLLAFAAIGVRLQLGRSYLGRERKGAE